MKTTTALFFCAVLWMAGTETLAQGTEERSVGSFDRIKVGEAIEVFLTHGSEPEVRVEAEGVDADKVVTEVSGETLEIHMKKGRYNNRDVKVYVTYNELEGIVCSSAARIYGKSTIEGDALTIRVTSAGKVELDVDVASLDISLTSSGQLELTGNAEEQETEVSSAGRLDAYGLTCENTIISVSSGGDARVTATEELDAEANSGGRIRYKGDPVQRNTNTNSGGAITAG